ncbi:MAG TPA: response regulator [Desulfobacterales bacterium]|nr:response regulator [Desulfobacterales bacterium]
MNTNAVMCHKTHLLFEHIQRDHRQILVVDDENDYLEFLSDLIFKMGFQVVTAASGIKGLNLFVKSEYDLVFTDFKMICSDGFSLAYHIKAISPETPVVMLVGQTREDPPDKKEGCCMDYLLFKPFGLKDIQYTVQKFFMTHSGGEGVDFHCSSKP